MYIEVEEGFLIRKSGYKTNEELTSELKNSEEQLFLAQTNLLEQENINKELTERLFSLETNLLEKEL